VDNSRRDLLIRAAWLYYEYALTQGQVAQRLGLSRSTVSRLLSEAEKEGVVEITLTQPLPEASRLEEELRERFGLDRALVGFRLNDESPMDAAAGAMGHVIEQIVARGSVSIATGWGRTLARSAARARIRTTSGVVIIDAVGHATAGVIAPAVEVTREFAAKFGAMVVHLPSPAFAPSASVASALRSAPEVSSTLEAARQADVVLTSVGVVGRKSLLVSEGFLPAKAMDRLVASGATGEILGNYYDDLGRLVPTNALFPIGLTLEDLRSSRRVIAVAGGRGKALALVGAIAGGLVKEIVVDDSAALGLLGER
jgi:DNA-binding transcriptional regulator LsrR (DeoR family)